MKCCLSTVEKKGNETRLEEGKSADPSLPSKELLFQIDWIFEVLVSFCISFVFTLIVGVLFIFSPIIYFTNY